MSHHAAAPQRHAAVVNVIAVVLPLKVARFPAHKLIMFCCSTAAAQHRRHYVTMLLYFSDIYILLVPCDYVYLRASW